VYAESWVRDACGRSAHSCPTRIYACPVFAVQGKQMCPKRLPKFRQTAIVVCLNERDLYIKAKSRHVRREIGGSIRRASVPSDETQDSLVSRINMTRESA